VTTRAATPEANRSADQGHLDAMHQRAFFRISICVKALRVNIARERCGHGQFNHQDH
jgi:hypothetical protein